MNKVKFFNKYPTNIDIDTDRDVEVYMDEFNATPVPAGAIRIVILEEPLKGTLFEQVQTRQDCYTHVLTYHEEILNTNPKATLLHSDCAKSWISNYVPQTKKFCVSALVGGKDNPQMKGYAVRHELWRAKDRITIPKDFYLSSHYKWAGVSYDGQKVLGDSKNPLFDSMFHIAIENTSVKDYFSEKILDCFQTKTIPIYYGCTNIGSYFNANGIIIVNSVQEIVDACNRLTPDDYGTLLSFAEENLKASNKWHNSEERVKNAVINLIK